MDCAITRCPRARTPNTPYCKQCGAGINHWSLRPAGEIDRRQTNLQIFSGRMAEVAPRRKRGKGKRNAS